LDALKGVLTAKKYLFRSQCKRFVDKSNMRVYSQVIVCGLVKLGFLDVFVSERSGKPSWLINSFSERVVQKSYMLEWRFLWLAGCVDER